MRSLILIVFALIFGPISRIHADAPLAPDPSSIEVPDAYREAQVPSAAPSLITPSLPRLGEPTVQIPRRIDTRLRALDRDLTALSMRGNPVSQGLMEMLTGGLSIGLGVLFRKSSDSVSTYMYLYGGMDIARGAATMLITPNTSNAAVEYAHMPMNTREELRVRLGYGEDQLRSIARGFRIARIVDASLSVTGSVLVIPFYFAPSHFRMQNPVDYLVLAGSAISLITGIFTFFSHTDAERRWNAYEDLRETLRQQRQQQAIHASVTPFVSSNGAGLAIHGVF